MTVDKHRNESKMHGGMKEPGTMPLLEDLKDGSGVIRGFVLSSIPSLA